MTLATASGQELRDKGNGDPDSAGYYHSAYAASFAELGTPRFLRRAGGWVIERQLRSLPYRDAMGCYPLFCCNDWAGLGDDLVDLAPHLVSVWLVADPFGSYDTNALRRIFDRFVPFKAHFVADLSEPPEQFVSKHHQYYARWALRKLKVEVHPRPSLFLDEWVDLYACLVRRHKIAGIAAFSREAFDAQLSVPGMVLFRAVRGAETVGAQLWCTQRSVAYSHLTAFNEHGYKLRAAYALHWTAIEYLRSAFAWLDLGASAGLTPGCNDGLTLFKRGWASGTRNAYFCGRVLNPARYAEAVARSGAGGSDYFPGYREGEFGREPG